MITPVQHLAERVRDYWLSQNLAVRPGVTPDQIAAFEARWGVVLPDDVRTFYSVVDPATNWQTSDGEFLTFHALEELAHFHTDYGTVPARPESVHWFIAVDYLARSWMLAYELLPEPRATCRVIFINGNCEMAFETLAELFETYLHDPEEVAYPQRVWPR